MRANFFVIYSVDHLDDVAVSYLAAYRAPDVAGFDNALVREFPNITNVDLSTTLAQVQRVLDQVIRAVEFLFGFRSEEHTSELQSQSNLVCRLLLEKKKKQTQTKKCN